MMIPIGPIKEIKNTIILCYTDRKFIIDWYDQEYPDSSGSLCIHEHGVGRTYLDFIDHPLTNERYVIETKYYPFSL